MSSTTADKISVSHCSPISDTGLWKEEINSSFFHQRIKGELAQVVERSLCMQEVVGSMPTFSRNHSLIPQLSGGNHQQLWWYNWSWLRIAWYLQSELYNYRGRCSNRRALSLHAKCSLVDSCVLQEALTYSVEVIVISWSCVSISHGTKWAEHMSSSFHKSSIIMI